MRMRHTIFTRFIHYVWEFGIWIWISSWPHFHLVCYDLFFWFPHLYVYFKPIFSFRRMFSNVASARIPCRPVQWSGPMTTTKLVCLYFRWFGGNVLRGTGNARRNNRKLNEIGSHRNGVLFVAWWTTYPLIILFLCDLFDLVEQLTDTQL